MVALLTAAKVAGALPAGKMGGAIVSGGAKALAKGGAKIGKEPIWSSGTTKGGEYLSSGDRKAIFRQSRAKISPSSSNIALSSSLVPSPSSEGAITAEGMGLDIGKNLEQRIANNEKKIIMLKRVIQTQKAFGGGELSDSSFIPTSSSLVPISKDKISSPTSSSLVPSPSSERAMTAEGIELDTGKTLEQRVTNNEKKITVIKRIVKIQQQPFAGGQLAEINAILQDIGNALALDFSNRISKEESEIDGLREDRESRKRAGAEAGVEQVKKVQSSLNKAFGKVIAPAKGLLGRIFGFFGNLLKGWVADNAL